MNKVEEVKSFLEDTNKDGVMDKPWNEGFVTGLLVYGIITEDEDKELIKWIIAG